MPDKSNLLLAVGVVAVLLGIIKVQAACVTSFETAVALVVASGLLVLRLEVGATAQLSARLADPCATAAQTTLFTLQLRRVKEQIEHGWRSNSTGEPKSCRPQAFRLGDPWTPLENTQDDWLALVDVAAPAWLTSTCHSAALGWSWGLAITQHGR